MDYFDNLAKANIERNKFWDSDGKITPSFRGNELAGETGEACNLIKKLERERLGIPGSRTTVEELGRELADVCICADLVAMEYGIDLQEFIKIVFNEKSDELNLPVKIK